MKAKERKKQKKTSSNRLNIMFFMIFLLFVALIMRLGYVQILSGDYYKNQVNQTEKKTVKTSVPRGRIMDKNYRMIVDNEGVNSIVYIQGERDSPKKMLKTAQKLSRYITLETDKITERDMKDYWMLLHPKKAAAKLNKNELQNEKLEQEDLYHLQLERITKADLDSITAAELKVLAIFREMKKGYAFTPQPIKDKGVTSAEIATVSEVLDDLPGVDIVIDWKRKYPYKDTFASVLGRVTTSETGLPLEKLSYYLARGYSRNDRVGTSQLEMKYEDVLQGVKPVNEVVTNNAGEIIDSKSVKEGQQGDDLVLTTDIELQKKVEDVLTKELIRAKSSGGGKFMDKAFVVMMNPMTGEILSMAGKQITRENGKLKVKDYALGTINSAYEMGSVVKGATVLTGYHSGKISPYTTMLDAPIQLRGTHVKKSVSSMGWVNEIDALKRSSNVYMFKLAMKMLGREYHPNMKLPNRSEAFDEMRYHFSQFGLGEKTGIDLPNESTGVKNRAETPGLLLDFAIGQYDTYTPMQLTQYVSTIANGGYRVQPHLVKEIRRPSTTDRHQSSLIRSFKPVYLNKIDNKDNEIANVQEGFRRVYQEQGGTAFKYFGHEPYRQYHIAGKTGTAQSFYYDPVKHKTDLSEPTYNLTLVGYAPYEHPEVAFSVVVPSMRSDNDPINKLIGQGIIKAYFDLKNGVKDNLEKEE
ncbi:peptidoglycan D,D-transpeptidase FtsI family protein [Bacillus testis]|uniref:peptidoglycan D,D-transpeptidase FtsI family protein n=1 Tax=Bacillus testis TaxID=1622072 RepID=UPI00067EC49B|nr:penicillin-binding protein 2 [Bacillus testis]